MHANDNNNFFIRISRLKKRKSCNIYVFRAFMYINLCFSRYQISFSSVKKSEDISNLVYRAFRRPILALNSTDFFGKIIFYAYLKPSIWIFSLL